MANAAVLVIIPSLERDGRDPAWLTALEKYPQMKLTVALSKADLPPLAHKKDVLLNFRRDRRLEPALRIATDPPLPLIYDMDLSKIYLRVRAQLPTEKISWPEDVAVPIVNEQLKYKEFWGVQPRGFIPGGGSMSTTVADFLVKRKFRWSVAGFPDAEWMDDEVLALDTQGNEPFKIMKAHSLSQYLYSDPENYNPAQPCCAPAKPFVEKMAEELSRERKQVPVIVFDEARSRLSLGDFLKELAVFTSSETAPLEYREDPLKLMLCSQISEPHLTDAQTASLQIWPYSWSWLRGLGNPPGPGLTVWIGDAAKNYAWNLLSLTRADVERFKNKGLVDTGKLDVAMEEFYQAESGEFYEWLGSGPTEAEENDPAVSQVKKQKEMLFKATLESVYRHLGLPVPNFLKRAAFAKGAPASGGTAPSAPSKPPAASLPTPPPVASPPPPSADRDVIFEWESRDDASTTASVGNPITNFSVSLSSSGGRSWVNFAVTYAGPVQSQTVTDLYIDINHRAGAGTTSLISGRNAALSHSDAWELLLVNRWIPARGWIASLYRGLSPSPAIYNSGVQYKTSSRAQSTTFNIRVPKALLGENPAQWGYLVCSAGFNSPIKDFLSSSRDKERLLDDIKRGISAELPMIRREGAVPGRGSP